MRNFAAHFHGIFAKEQGTAQQFKELLPHGEEFPTFRSSGGVTIRAGVPS
jgi:hypothetical protein